MSIANVTRNFIDENVKLSFVAATITAQEQITNGTVLGVHLGVTQGYLVYNKFFVGNAANGIGHLIVIDAGSINVLCVSEGHPLRSFFTCQCTDTWAIIVMEDVVDLGRGNREDLDNNPILGG